MYEVNHPINGCSTPSTVHALSLPGEPTFTTLIALAKDGVPHFRHHRSADQPKSAGLVWPEQPTMLNNAPAPFAQL